MEKDEFYTEEGHTFVRSLSQFIRQHEKALANSLQLSVQRRQSLSALNAPSTLVSGLATKTSGSSNAAANPLAAALSFAGLSFKSHSMKSPHLILTPHHLFFLLSKIEELDVDVGPMNVRIESLHGDSSAGNYVSFLQGHKGLRTQSDRDSVHSVSSMRSVMSSMTTFWSSLSLMHSTSRTEKAKAQQAADLKYLYSAFTKVPSLKLVADSRAPLIQGFEEFPFDTAVPLYSFKNLQQLDIIDIDFRSFHGWDRLSEQLTLLTVKRANLDDPAELLTDIVLDDAEQRRRRSTKGGRSSPTPASSSWTVPSTPRGDYTGTRSDPGSPVSESPKPQDSVLSKDATILAGSVSPKRPSVVRPATSYKHVRSYSTKASRSGSGSSNSSEYSSYPFRSNSSSSLLNLHVLPSTKWQRLKYLSLADNRLSSISAKSLAPVAATLRSLNLSNNLFTEIPDALACLTRLSSLDLSNCMIGSLQSLTKSPLPAITTIKLKSNRLTSLAGVERMLSLENISVQDNHLKDVMEAARLTALPNLRRVWIKHNPFTKTTNNYRVQIFNLFRTTAGYSEDIVLDDYSPGYTEKKQLVERVPEKEPRTSQTIVQIAEPVVVHDDAPAQEQREGADIHKASTRRRRTARRRIVDLAHDEGRWEPQAEIKVVSRPSDDIRRPLDMATVDQDHTASRTRSASQPADVSVALTMPGTDGVAGTEPSRATHDSTYRDQAEALRRELGSTWLSALESQNWHGSHHLDVQNMQSMGHPPSLHRANTVAVVTGRTLG
ncbi:putative leucine-rich repeat-containing protein [Cyphellophora attinorum]|uniref:Putative leucine-rich repeat-containing protein n=1 Tax=Cyphellophora attinorum TaxID=1664694 RepID=A0A0N1HGG3_9EURO|nr:putative leucine-rich repeat-containing protein [Phialophora attinorum]KPI45263.1 putative leucine-rich repeat-containing protein [Phialophora attinorum]